MSLRNSVFTVALLCVSAGAVAGVSPDQAKRLGQDLTPMGAERAGNADGSIPAWNGGLTEAPAAWGGPGSRYVEAFPDDEPLFTITAANLDQYRDRLTPGQIALFEKWPDSYKMPVYQSRRTVAKPQWVYDKIRDNAVSGELVNNGEGVAGATGGIPFPFPEATPDPGKAIVWNHKLRYRGISVQGVNTQITTTPGGTMSVNKLRQDVLFNYSRRNIEPADLHNIAIYFLQIILEPPRLAGGILLVHETIDQVKEPRVAWTYNPGQRRIRRAPNVAYDNPGTASDGLRTNDQLDMFNGATDRYQWKVLGKKEIYIPYNSYAVHNEPDYNRLLGSDHVNQDLTRYELHRVWVVEGKVRPGTSHIYDRRVFYVDEDSWHISVAEHYDTRGNLWRVAEGHAIQNYGEHYQLPVMEAQYDLFSNRYILVGLNNDEPEVRHDLDFDLNHFNPRNVQRMSVK